MQFTRGEFQSGLFPCSPPSPSSPSSYTSSPHSLPPEGSSASPSSSVRSLRAMPPTDIYIIGPDTSDPSPDRLNLLNWWRLVYGREGEQFGGNETGSRERGREREREVGRPMCNISPLRSPFSILPRSTGLQRPTRFGIPLRTPSLNRGVSATTPSGNCHLYAGISFVVPLPLSPLLKLVLLA